MVFVRSVDAPQICPDCTGIGNLCLSDGRRLSREEAYWIVYAGNMIRSGSETGPKLLTATRGATRYVRTQPNDTADDNLLSLPRGC